MRTSPSFPTHSPWHPAQLVTSFRFASALLVRASRRRLPVVRIDGRRPSFLPRSVETAQCSVPRGRTKFRVFGAAFREPSRGPAAPTPRHTDRVAGAFPPVFDLSSGASGASHIGREAGVAARRHPWSRCTDCGAAPVRISDVDGPSRPGPFTGRRPRVQRIYFDYNASSPLAEPVIAAMSPFLREGFGNPSSLHWAGRPGRAAFEQARAQVAELLGCEPEEIFFTSGGTESNNFAIKGVFHRLRERGRHFVISAVEHPAVHRPIAFLERECGARVTVVPVDRTGRVSVDGVLEALTPETILVSIMHANNEVGTLQPVEEIGRACRERGVLFHTDAAQAVGKVAIDAPRLPCDLLSVAGHKLQAPKGVGALFVRKGVELEPFMHGAGHERGWRAGTENVLL
ncbi:MAG: cysteine desulfurase, partial [Candidatus Eisenbacteria bacterium]|nr:cysteine desulfurase [Candidatus Eisenbacteria bacterium]